MKKSKLNFIINGLMFLCMSAIAGIGFLIKYTLIPGQQRWIVYNDNVELYMLGMDRHEWGTIHLILGYVLLGLLVIHIIYHMKAISGVYNQIFQRKLIRKLIFILFITICVLFFIVPFLIHPTISKLEYGKGRLNVSSNNNLDREGRAISEKGELKNIEFLNVSRHSNLILEVRGYMTLNEISKKHEVPIGFIKTRLKIPECVSCEEKLSWLRKRYNIRINDVKKTITDYQNKIE